jgi:hypothetical protein
MKILKFLLLGFALALAACSTDFYSYSGSPVLVGQGGASTNVSGIDLWIVGTPPRKYRVIGYITDSRPAGPLIMATRNGALAAKVRAAGGDGLIMSADYSQYVGTVTVANASGSAYTTGNATFWNGGGYFDATTNTNAFATATSVPMYRQNSRYWVIKYL